MKCPDSFIASFYIRQNKNKRKDYSVYCCIKVNQRSVEICVHRSIEKKDWCVGKAKPKQENDYLIKLSIYLDSIKAELFNIYMDIKLAKRECSAGIIKSIYLGKEDQQITYLQLFDKALVKYKTELAPGSLKNYFATRTYLQAFCRSKFKSGDISLKYLNYNTIDELKTYILSNPLRPNDPCTNNGCMKHLERIKKIISWAYEMRFIDRDVFTSFKIKKKPFESKRLSWDQLQRIECRSFQNSMLSLVRDLFIFCCYTGMAPGDMQRLQAHQINPGAGGIQWLSYSRSKNEMPANVPLLKPAFDLIKKYKLDKGNNSRYTVFPFVTNKDLNSSIKIISEVCELGMSINFYVARHTFASTVTLSNGVSITSIRQMMGHKKIESTLHYARTNNIEIANEMSIAQERMDIKSQNDS